MPSGAPIGVTNWTCGVAPVLSIIRSEKVFIAPMIES